MTILRREPHERDGYDRVWVELPDDDVLILTILSTDDDPAILALADSVLQARLATSQIPRPER